MAREELIYGNLGGMGQQSGEYGDPYNPRMMTVYNDPGVELERRLMSEAADIDFAAAEDALMQREASQRPELGMLAARQAPEPVAAPMAAPRPMSQREAIMAEQRALGVTVDGIVGPETMRARARRDAMASQLQASPEVEAGLARARQVLASAPDGDDMVMPTMRVTGARPAALTPEQEQAERGLAAARSVLQSAPDGMTPYEAMMRRRRDAEYQRVVDGAESANARQTADMRAQDIGAALGSAGQEFLAKLERGQVDMSQYTDADRQVKPVRFDRALDASMNAQRPYTFEYLPGAGPAGRRAGVMAQDLERTPLGAATVRSTPQGKMVDVGQLGGLNAAQIGRLNERVSKLEEK
jgi:peptidoglycan hydrolase-like protein with peptidoglycan-binding domain